MDRIVGAMRERAVLEPTIRQSIRRPGPPRCGNCGARRGGGASGSERVGRRRHRSPVGRPIGVGRGLGWPAPLPFPLLWYIPIRAFLRLHGENDRDLADFTACVPLAFLRVARMDLVPSKERWVAAWARAVALLPHGSRGRAERAGYGGALALWWSGCFGDYLAARGGTGLVRSYSSFAAAMFRDAGTQLRGSAPALGALYERSAQRIALLRAALREVARRFLTETDPDALPYRPQPNAPRRTAAR